MFEREFKYITDYCAVILTGITLFEGLNVNYGTVAVYGKDNFAPSLQKYETYNSRSEFESMLHKDSKIQVQSHLLSHGPISSYVCVPDDLGVKGLEEYLNDRGFFSTLHSYERKAAELYIKKLDNRSSKINIDGELLPDRNSWNGRDIAAAVTMGHIQLTGPYSCASSKGNQAFYSINMHMPLDMGNLMFITKMVYKRMMKGLAFINGDLRILTSTKNSIDIHKRPIWDIYPKLDWTENHGLMSRSVLDDFFMDFYVENNNPILEENKSEYVLLGCLNGK